MNAIFFSDNCVQIFMNQTVHSLLGYVVLLRDFSLAERITLVDITLDFLDQVFVRILGLPGFVSLLTSLVGVLA